MTVGNGAAGYRPIADYALIGDCHSAALVSRGGAVDWYCPGRFDAPAVFCRLLDAERGGTFVMAPAGISHSTRTYRGPTNVLDTTFYRDDGGVVRVTDFMPVHPLGLSREGYDVGTSNQLLRCAEGLAGVVDLEVIFKPTFDYARVPPRLVVVPGRGAVASATAGTHPFLTLACPTIRLEPHGEGVLRGLVRLRAGERIWVALTHAQDERDAMAALALGAPEEKLATTLRYWEQWAACCTYRGPYRAAVVRSALVLKLLDHEPSGAIVAAPTTSLPEDIGGVRNWDYRYAWLRDSALMLYALGTIGYPEEALDFFRWLDTTARLTAEPSIMYRVGGERDLAEVVLGNLEGYRGSRPVRIGNGAATQRQLDVYGEVLRGAYLCFRHVAGRAGAGEVPGDGRRPSGATWELLRWLTEQAVQNWTQPDQGIWEVRGAPRHFLNSKLLCWAAVDRGLRLASECGLEAPIDRWRRARGDIGAAILKHGYNAERGAFTQSFGSTVLDASALRIPLLGFLPATDPRVRATRRLIARELTHDGLVYRYPTSETDDGQTGGEGTFVLCTFWLVQALALDGKLEEAEVLFEQTIRRANDVGLMAEQIDPRTGDLLGNFPQGFTHLALIEAAVNLAKVAKHGREAAAETETERAVRAEAAAAEEYSHGSSDST